MFNKILICLYIIGVVLCENGPRVKIAQGTVEGTYKTSYYGRPFAAFEGIPYAKPPVNELRFTEPEAAGNWSDVLIANKKYTCSQFLPIPVMGGFQGKEDCLYMYVYVPRTEINENENLPVIVHIHGGAYMVGSPSMMAGPDYFMDKNIVYVSFNYRLGILGFTSTEDEVVSGNNGLKDQSLALKWIKNNIKSFGGNPDSITITGLSAGGGSVQYHYLSPLSRGLFTRGYSQSGTVLQSYALTKKPLNNIRKISTHLNCTVETNEAMIECLRQVPVKDLILSLKSLLVYLDGFPITPFGPVIEHGPNPFLSDHPYKLLKEKKVYDVPWISSNVKQEGIIPVGFFVLLKKLDELNEKWDDLMPYCLDIFETVNASQWKNVLSKMKEFYLKNDSVSMENINDFVQMFTDRIYLIDSELALRLHAEAVKSPVYYYFYSFVADEPTFFKGMPKGVSHGDDGKLMWKFIISSAELSSTDEMMKDYLVDFLVTYAISGKPQFKNILNWTPVNSSRNEIDYLDIATLDDVSMKSAKEFAPSEFYRSLPIMENMKLFS